MRFSIPFAMCGSLLSEGKSMKCISTSVRASTKKLRASASTSAYGSGPTCMDVRWFRRAILCDNHQTKPAGKTVFPIHLPSFLLHQGSSNHKFIIAYFFTEQFFSIKSAHEKNTTHKNCAIALFLYRLKNISPPVRRKPANRPDLPCSPSL